jgi:hypothetical protein
MADQFSLTPEQVEAVRDAYRRDGPDVAIRLAARLVGTTQWPVAANVVREAMNLSPFTVVAEFGPGEGA